MENENFFTNDDWRIVIDVDMSAYEFAVANVKAEKMSFEENRK